MASSTPGRRFSITRSPRDRAALEKVAECTDLSRNDAVNQAVIVNALITERLAAGSELVLRDREGTLRVVHLV